MVDLLGNLGLSIGEPNAEGSKTEIIPPNEPVPFLGMELCLKPTGKYQLRVSQDCVADCIKRLSDAGSIQYLLEKNVSLGKMGPYFSGIVEGYRNAYAAAHNLASLQDATEHASKKSQGAILKQLFGPQLKSLTPEQFNFIGIEREFIFDS